MWGAGSTREISQFCFEPKTAPQKKVLKKDFFFDQNTLAAVTSQWL